MNLKSLRNLSKDDILDSVGLQTKPTLPFVGTLGVFGVGMLVGAGIALLVAPKPGRVLREDLRERLRRAPQDLTAGIKDVVGSPATNETESTTETRY